MFQIKKLLKKLICKKIADLVPELKYYSNMDIEHLSRIMMDKDIPNFRKYYHVLSSNDEEVAFLKKNLTLIGSHLFRGNGWETLNKECLSTFSGFANVRVWCAGCSSGEEVYSVIMSLLDYVPVNAIEILATDYNPEKLDRCRQGVYGPTHLNEVPEKYRKYLVYINTSFTFNQEIKERITVKPLNLLFDDYPQGFDLILCRNVIKFFNEEKIIEVQKKLIQSLKPNGYLFVGGHDEANDREIIKEPQSFHLRQIGESIYQKV